MLELEKMCKKTSHHKLLCNLISRFDVVDIDKRKQFLKEITNQITDVWKLPQNKTVIVAITKGHEADSAQTYANLIEPYLARRNYHDIRVINSFRKCTNKDILRDYPNIVFLDEFIGTGTTMQSRVDELKGFIRTYYDSQIIAFNNHSIKICALACMNDARTSLEGNGLELFAPLSLSKGIADYYSGIERRKAYRAILELEKQLDKSKDVENTIFPCGYKKSESLYVKDEGNAVNNLFPIFWWAYEIGDKKRKTLFYRKKI